MQDECVWGGGGTLQEREGPRDLLQTRAGARTLEKGMAKDPGRGGADEQGEGEEQMNQGRGGAMEYITENSHYRMKRVRSCNTGYLEIGIKYHNLGTGWDEVIASA